MGRVWRGYDSTLDRTVAVKEVVLPDGLDDGDRRELMARTLREARAAARLQHPGIVTVHDVVEDGGVPWIVMEYVDGRSLQQQLKAEGGVSWREAARIGAAVADALAHAHAAGVVHRDLKPDNVLLAGKRVVLTDFGIARILDAATHLTRTGTVIGTPHYMAPEQLEGRQVGPPADLWALGATLYTAVAGRPPFDGPTLTSVYAAILTRPLPAVPGAGPLESELAALVDKDPEARPSAETTARTLQELLSRASDRPAPEPQAAARVRRGRQDAGPAVLTHPPTELDRPAGAERPPAAPGRVSAAAGRPGAAQLPWVARVLAWPVWLLVAGVLMTFSTGRPPSLSTLSLPLVGAATGAGVLLARGRRVAAVLAAAVLCLLAGAVLDAVELLAVTGVPANLRMLLLSAGTAVACGELRRVREPGQLLRPGPLLRTPAGPPAVRALVLGLVAALAGCVYLGLYVPPGDVLLRWAAIAVMVVATLKLRGGRARRARPLATAAD